MFCRGLGGGYGPRVYWGVKHGTKAQSQCPVAAAETPVFAAAAAFEPCLLPYGKICTHDPTGLRCYSRALWTFGGCPLSRPSVLGAEGCLDSFAAAATLAHELSWTRVCLQDPRRCAADCWRRCPIIPAVLTIPLNRRVLACWYPNYGKFCFIHGCLAVDPKGVPLRPNSSCGVASWCRCLTCLVLPRPPRSHYWSRMLPTIKARAPLWSRP